MNKSEIIADIANNVNTQRVGAVTHKQVEAILDDFFGLVVDRASNTEETSWPAIGKFHGVRQPAREGRNPSTGESMHVPAKTVIKFKPGAKVKRQVNGEEG